MHMLTVVFGPASISWMFQEPEKADAIFADIEGARIAKTSIAFTDDFGHRASIDGATICGMLLEDMEKSKMARVEHTLHNTRIQMLANKMAQSDPALRAASMMQGPAVLQPMGNGRFPG